MGTIIEDLSDHEGFGARRLLDGSLTGTWTRETARFDAHVAACGCGWQGEQAHPPTEAGYEAAVDEWERAHARPLLAETVPTDVASTIREVKQAIGDLLRERPKAAARALDDLGTWTVLVRRKLDPPPVDPVRRRLDSLGSRDRGEALGL